MANRFMLAVTLCFCHALPIAAQEETVILANGSLEEATDDQPTGWMMTPPSSGFPISHNSGNALVGDGCAVIDATTEDANPRSFGNLSQSLDITPWSGKTVRFRAAVRVTERLGDGRAQLWFRIDGEPSAGRSNTIAFDNMRDRTITSGEWKYYEITSKIPDESQRLVVGMLAFAHCKAWIDDVTLEVIDDVETTTTERFGLDTSGRAGDGQQPFFNHWLWLVLISVALLAISQLGRFGGAVTLKGEMVGFGAIRKFALRFSVVYWLLYCLPSPFTSLLFSWGMKLYTWYSGMVDKVVRWTASDVLGIERDLVPPGGSGDTTFDFVRLFVCFAVAIAIALVWSIIDRRKTDYRYVNDLLRSYLRYVLAFTMLGYGLAKVGMVFNQFPEIGISQLNKNWGDSSPMNAVWNFMGASRPYTIFAGLGECIGGLLLIWRRTTTLGGMVTFGVMLNVVMLNFCYDVPVKQYSFHLLIMALFLILPDAHRLANVLFWNRPTITVKSNPPYTSKVTIWIHRAIKAYVIIVGAGLPIYNKIQTEVNDDASQLAQPAWFGSYEVEEFRMDGNVVPPLTTDGIRWKSFGITRYPWTSTGEPGQTDQISIVMMDGTYGGGPCEIDESEESIYCRTMTPSNMKLKTNGDDLVEISSAGGGAEFVIRLRRVEREDFLLINRGFRWINERPYNR